MILVFVYFEEGQGENSISGRVLRIHLTPKGHTFANEKSSSVFIVNLNLFRLVLLSGKKYFRSLRWDSYVDRRL